MVRGREVRKGEGRGIKGEERGSSGAGEEEGCVAGGIERRGWRCERRGEDGVGVMVTAGGEAEREVGMITLLRCTPRYLATSAACVACSAICRLSSSPLNLPSSSDSPLPLPLPPSSSSPSPSIKARSEGRAEEERRGGGGRLHSLV